jgi:hypothetical protein
LMMRTSLDDFSVSKLEECNYLGQQEQDSQLSGILPSFLHVFFIQLLTYIYDAYLIFT